MLPAFAALHSWADAQAPRVPVAVAGAADPTVLEALAQARMRGWVKPILVGESPAIHGLAAEMGIALSGFRVVDSEDLAAAAVGEVRAGRAELLMKGRIGTPAFMQAVLDPDFGLRTGRTICQVVLMEIVDQERRFLMADTGITIHPSLTQKVEILESLVGVSRALGTTEPRVAIVTASEKATKAMPETLDAAELVGMKRAGAFPGAAVEGPLSFDLAYAAEAGDRKQIQGDVIGAADAMLFPDLSAANLTVKAMMYTAQSRFGGVLCSTACPVVFMSRADSVEARLNSLALALRVAAARP